MRLALVVALLVGFNAAQAQVTSSGNMGCTITAAGGMGCNGIGAPETDATKGLPKLFVTNFTIEPGGALDEPGAASDCLILGLNGGDLLNEKPPYLHVSLEKDAVTLMPKAQPYRLRNKGPKNVELRLLEIQR